MKCNTKDVGKIRLKKWKRKDSTQHLLSGLVTNLTLKKGFSKAVQAFKSRKQPALNLLGPDSTKILTCEVPI